jgi:hypothetical protein
MLADCRRQWSEVGRRESGDIKMTLTKNGALLQVGKRNFRRVLAQ